MIHMAVVIDVTVVKRKEYFSAIISLNVVAWIILVGTAEKDKINETRLDCFRGGGGAGGNQGYR